jgi:hypothetical protein
MSQIVRRICFKEVMGFPKDIDVFAQTVISGNTTSIQRDIARSSKQGGVSEITRKNWNTSSVQNGGQNFKPELT